VIPYKGNDEWIEETLIKAYKCLISDEIPEPSANCDYCKYNKAILKINQYQKKLNFL